MLKVLIFGKRLRLLLLLLLFLCKKMEKDDGCGGGGSGRAGADADLASSEAGGGGGGVGGTGVGGSEMEEKNTAEGEPKVKRKMKTAFQLETLEKTYAGLVIISMLFTSHSSSSSFLFFKNFLSCHLMNFSSLIYLFRVQVQNPFLDVFNSL